MNKLFEFRLTNNNLLSKNLKKQLKSFLPIRSFCEIKPENGNKNRGKENNKNLFEFDKNNSLLILKEMNTKYTLSFTQITLMSVSAFSLYNLVNSVIVAKYIPVMGWGFIFYLSLALNVNLFKNQRKVIREIRLNRKPNKNYELEIRVMGSLKKLSFDLKDLTIRELKDKNNKWPSNQFTRVAINEEEFVIPIKTIAVFNENMYSKFLTGRISDYFE